MSRGTQRRPGFLPPANSVGCNSVAALGLLTRTSSGHKVSPKTRLQPPILARALTRANSTSLELVSHHPRFTSLCPRAATVCTAPKRSCSTGTRPAHAQTRCLHNEPAYLDAPSGDRRQGATRGGGAWSRTRGGTQRTRSTAPRWALRRHASRLEVRCAGRERRLANRALGGAARQPIATQAGPPAAHDVPSRVLSLRYLRLYLIQSFAARLQLVRQL